MNSRQCLPAGSSIREPRGTATAARYKNAVRKIGTADSNIADRESGVLGNLKDRTHSHTRLAARNAEKVWINGGAIWFSEASEIDTIDVKPDRVL